MDFSESGKKWLIRNELVLGSNHNVPLQNISLLGISSGRNSLEDLFGDRRDVAGLGGVFSKNDGATSDHRIENWHFCGLVGSHRLSLEGICKAESTKY